MIKKIAIQTAANFSTWGEAYTAPAGNAANVDFPILQKTITKSVVGVENGQALKYAWFDQPTPNTFLSPTTTGTTTVSGAQIQTTIISFLDPPQLGFLVLSTTDGTGAQCLSNAMPCEVT